MKIAFDIKFRPQIERGEYKVVTSDGRPVEIIKWDCRGQAPILVLVAGSDADESYFFTERGCTLNEKEWLYIEVGELKWKPVVKDVYIKEPAIAHERNISGDDIFKGYILVADHTLKKDFYDKYIMLDDLERINEVSERKDSDKVDLKKCRENLDKPKVIYIAKDFFNKYSLFFDEPVLESNYRFYSPNGVWSNLEDHRWELDELKEGEYLKYEICSLQ